jgi:hypothetical protein
MKPKENLLFMPFPEGKFVCSKCGSFKLIPSCDYDYEKDKVIEFAKCLDCDNNDTNPMTKEEYVNRKRTKLIDQML